MLSSHTDSGVVQVTVRAELFTLQTQTQEHVFFLAVPNTMVWSPLWTVDRFRQSLGYINSRGEVSYPRENTVHTQPYSMYQIKD